MLGPIETLGMLPAIAATVVALDKLMGNRAANVSWFEMGVAALTGLYIGALCGVFMVHRVEHYCLLLRMAQKVREERVN